MGDVGLYGPKRRYICEAHKVVDGRRGCVYRAYCISQQHAVLHSRVPETTCGIEFSYRPIRTREDEMLNVVGGMNIKGYLSRMMYIMKGLNAKKQQSPLKEIDEKGNRVNKDPKSHFESSDLPTWAIMPKIPIEEIDTTTGVIDFEPDLEIEYEERDAPGPKEKKAKKQKQEQKLAQEQGAPNE